MSYDQYWDKDFDCDYCGTETMVDWYGPYVIGILPRGWREDYNHVSCMSGQCYEDHLYYIEDKETGSSKLWKKKNDTWLDSIINHLKDKYETLNFYPSNYDSQWHVSIRDCGIVYRLYPYHKRQDCIDECREMNKRHNA
jgi:hypothetical protein